MVSNQLAIPANTIDKLTELSGRKITNYQPISAKCIDSLSLHASVATPTAMTTKQITLDLTDEQYDILVDRLIESNLPLIEQDARQHKTINPITPTEYIMDLVWKSFRVKS